MLHNKYAYFVSSSSPITDLHFKRGCIWIILTTSNRNHHCELHQQGMRQYRVLSNDELHMQYTFDKIYVVSEWRLVIWNLWSGWYLYCLLFVYWLQLHSCSDLLSEHNIWLDSCSYALVFTPLLLIRTFHLLSIACFISFIFHWIRWINDRKQARKE